MLEPIAMGRPAVKWKRVYRALRSQLIALSPGEPLGRTIEQLAVDFGVNHKTVCRAIDVLKSEKLIDAKPNVGLRVGINRPKDPGDGRWILYLRARGMKGVRFDTLFCRIAEPHIEKTNLAFRSAFDDELPEIEPMLTGGAVVGVVASMMMDSQLLRDAIARFRKLGIPVCVIDEIIPEIDSVVFDNRAFGRLVGRMLLSNPSFERILILQHLPPDPVSLARENGIREIQDEIRPSSRKVWWATLSINQLGPWLETLAKQGIRFDACYLPILAYSNGFRILRDRLSVPLPNFVSIELTEVLWFYRVNGVTVPVDAMTLTAIDTLFDRMKKPETASRVILQPPGICYDYRDEPPEQILPIIHLFPPRLPE